MDGKRVRTDSKFPVMKMKCAKIYVGDEGRISQLPDDILVDIISYLSLKEAACTSVLSSRWLNLWKNTPCLNFDADSVIYKNPINKKARKATRREYIEWINHVLQTHKASTLKEFKICFDFSKSSQKEITKWLTYAFSKQVQRLEVDLSSDIDTSPILPLHCFFPKELLPTQNYKYSLKALTLTRVDVSGEAIEFILRNCPLLEKLIVRGESELRNLEVCGSSLALKHLEIFDCYNLTSLKVSAPNLTSFKFELLLWGGVLLENVPMLVDVRLTCGYGRAYTDYIIPALSCCMSQLEILTLEMGRGLEKIELGEVPHMPKLKKLVLDCDSVYYDVLIALISLISASPYLEEFVLKLSSYVRQNLDRKVKNTIKFPHEHLKVVKFYGYLGYNPDVKLVDYFLDNCVALEELIIDAPVIPSRIDVEKIPRNQVKQQLEAQVPRHIELVIL